MKILILKSSICARYSIMAFLFFFLFSVSGCSCGGTEQKDAVDYEKVRKNRTASSDKPAAPSPAERTAAKPPAPSTPDPEPKDSRSGNTPGGQVQKILNEARKAGKIDVRPAAPGCEAAREKLKNVLKNFKFERDFNDESMASVVKELGDKTGFKFKADPGLAEKKISMRSAGRKFAFFMREIDRMGAGVILTPENDILLKSAEERGGKSLGRGGGKRESLERPAGFKPQSGFRPNAGRNKGDSGDNKSAAPDVDVFDDTDIF